MSTFSQLMSAHRRSGKSYASAASTSAIQAGLSAVDPRQIFSRNDTLTALLPFLKPYAPRGPQAKNSGEMALKNEMRGVREEIKDLKNEINEIKSLLKALLDRQQ